jgi:hypothetical protein
VFNVSAGGELLLLPLGSGAYTATTSALTVRWE